MPALSRQQLASPDHSARQGDSPGVSASKCRLCACTLDPAEDDDLELRVCGSCKDRPEARRLAIGLAARKPRRPHLVRGAGGPPAREFTPAECSLIHTVHAYMPAQTLLDLLNERLVCDLGPDAQRYTHEQLQAQIDKIATPTALAGGTHDWASLRKLLAQARRSGVLEQVTEQVIDDFAVVFSLNPKQVLTLKDVLLQQQEHAQ